MKRELFRSLLKNALQSRNYTYDIDHFVDSFLKNPRGTGLTESFKEVCRALKIKCTYKSIEEYLS